MNSTKNWNATATQPRIVMPTFGHSAFGAAVCGRTDVPAAKRDAALISGASFGTSVWRPPSD